MNKYLVVYYSFSDTTRQLAKQISQIMNADIRELIPEKPYSFDYNTVAKEVRLEIENSYCPKLVSGYESIDNYDTIFLGTPNWFKSMAPPVLTFIKTVVCMGNQ